MNPKELPKVWKALADPTRREILDLLRVRPRTTSELIEPFDLSRFAIMKHLKVLHEAELITVKRQGRTRWNRLNAVPIQQIYTRWVKPYEGAWSQTLLRVKQESEKPQRKAIEPMVNPEIPANFGVTEIELEIAIKSSVERVWKTLTEETSQWWNRDFFSNSQAIGFKIDAKLGGFAYEDWGNGAGQVWYTIIGLEPPKMLMMQGLLTREFGGPSHSILQLKLTKSGKGTKLRLIDTLFGHLSGDKRDQTREGWNLLFDAGLRVYLERADS